MSCKIKVIIKGYKFSLVWKRVFIILRLSNKQNLKAFLIEVYRLMFVSKKEYNNELVCIE